MTRLNNKKLRAVFLAALMFLWVFAGTVAFAGSAAAQDVKADGDTINGQNFYQGQEFELNLSTTSSGSEITVDDGDTVQVRRVTGSNSDGEPTQATIELTTSADSQSNVTFDTSTLPTGEEYVIYVDSGSNTGFLNTTGKIKTGTLNQVANSNSTVASFSIAEQTLSTSFQNDDDESEARAGESIEFSLQSNQRAEFGVNITEANGDLDNEQLEQLFFNGTNNISTQANLTEGNLDGDDDAIQIYVTNNDFDQDVTIPADEDSIDPGEYTLEFEVNDTTATSTADLTVLEEIEGGVTFDQGTFTETRGDIVEISGTTQGNLNEFNLTVGTLDDTGYQANVTVEPNDDGEFTVLMNTRNAGQAGNDLDHTPADIDDMDDAVFGTAEDQGEVTAAQEHSDANDLASVLTASTYDLQAHDPEDPPADFGAYAIATMDLTERSTDSINLWRADQALAPGDDEIDNVDDINAAIEAGTLTQTDTVAIGDRADNRASTGDLLVHEIGVSGVYGEGTGYNDLINNTGNLTLEYEQADPAANTGPLELNLTEMESSDFDIVVDRENDRFFAVVNSENIMVDRGDSPQALPVDETFEVRYNVSADYLADFERNAEEGDDGFVLGEDDEIVSQDLDVVDREIDFQVNENDEIVVPPTADAEISGTTTIAPGTEFTIRAQGTGDAAFLRTADDLNVSEDGSFAGTLDFSEIEDGTEFEATVRQQGFDANGATDGVVMEGAGEPTDTPEPDTDTPEPDTDTPEPEPDTDTPEPEPDTDEPEPTETPEDQPGFGVVVSLIALLGAALLVARRNAQN